jgi:hypothetical protein
MFHVKALPTVSDWTPCAGFAFHGKVPSLSTLSMCDSNLTFLSHGPVGVGVVNPSEWPLLTLCEKEGGA